VTKKSYLEHGKPNAHSLSRNESDNTTDMPKSYDGFI
jgi:hypothetical protein